MRCCVIDLFVFVSDVIFVSSWVAGDVLLNPYMEM